MAMIFGWKSASDRASNYRVSIDLQKKYLKNSVFREIVHFSVNQSCRKILPKRFTDEPRGNFFGFVKSRVDSNLSLILLIRPESTESSSPNDDSMFEFRSKVDIESSRDLVSRWACQNGFNF